MKKQILLASAGCIIGATVIGIGSILGVNDSILLTKLLSVSTMLGMASMGTFFIGLVFPKE